MKRSNSIIRSGLLVFILLLAGAVQSQSQANRPRRIAVFGSSVAFGTGDEFNKEGYTGLLREMLAPRGWEVFNQSRGGDTTKTIAPRFAPEGAPQSNVRYLMTVNPSYVVIALALANEGILEAKTKEAKDAVFKQYADGIKSLIDRARQNNVEPVVGLAYPRMAYTPVEYEYVRRMNLLMNTWDVPTVNLLGALDDGTGRYALGFDSDDRHPNAAGHRELATTFVPTLFDALEKGKPIPTKATAIGFARVSEGIAPFTFTAPETVHPFAMTFMVRTEADGTVAAISGSTLAAKSETKTTGRGSYESMTLNTDRPFTATIAAQNGKWIYKSASGGVIQSNFRADWQWHRITLSHYTARGETLFFVDRTFVGKIEERLQPNRFVLGGPGTTENPAAPKQADYRELFLYRSALNADEVTAINEGKLIQASLEIYAPLTDAQFRPDTSPENRAQSLTALKVGAGRIEHEPSVPTRGAR